jgi:hypothetical protein
MPDCRAARAADHCIITREERRQLIDCVTHQIAEDDLNTRLPDFRDVALLGWIAGLNSALAEQDADPGTVNSCRATRKIAENRHAEFAGAQHQDIPGLHSGNSIIHRSNSFNLGCR